MAETKGLVQKLKIIPGAGNSSFACAFIGPSPTNTELLLVLRENTDSAHAGSFKNSMVDALATAMVGRREVVAVHGDTDALITGLRIEPA